MNPHPQPRSHTLVYLTPLLLALALGPASKSLAQEAACPTQPIACNESIQGQLTTQDCVDGNGRRLDVYRFSGTAGTTVTASLFSAAFATDLALKDPSFNEVAEAEGDNPGDTASFSYTLGTTSNNWRLVAKSDTPGATGPYTLTLQCSTGGTPPPPPPPPGDGFFLDPAYPGFAFRVRLGEGANVRTGNREANCQPETVCVSGALPGRSEVFLRIIGPRPNGYLWPTVVRFTPARVVVEVRQLATGQQRTYVLAAVPPGVDELSGLQDRFGFLP